ncbi:hypothetical protein KC357_g280 [Hortaea werneckii]|nr:hypothetical protein KC357_g280 [Hortaea werneckii]
MLYWPLEGCHRQTASRSENASPGASLRHRRTAGIFNGPSSDGSCASGANIAIASGGVTGWVGRLSCHGACRRVVLVVVVFAVVFFVTRAGSWLGSVLGGHSHSVVIFAVLFVFSTTSRLGSVLGRGGRILRAHSGICILLLIFTIFSVLFLGTVVTSAQLLGIRRHLYNDSAGETLTSMVLRAALLLNIARKRVQQPVSASPADASCDWLTAQSASCVCAQTGSTTAVKSPAIAYFILAIDRSDILRPTPAVCGNAGTPSLAPRGRYDGSS